MYFYLKKNIVAWHFTLAFSSNIVKLNEPKLNRLFKYLIV